MNKEFPLQPKHREMIEWCLKNSSHFQAMGFRSEEYILLNRVFNSDVYFEVDKDILNKVRKRYIEWVIELPF